MTLRTEEFYAYLVERENIRLRRLAGQPWPWTENRILQEYSFTNVKRIHDKTTQKFIHLLYENHQDDDPRLVLLNAAIARYFGTPEFVEAISGWQTRWEPERVATIAMHRLATNEPVFTGAYLITSGGMSGPKSVTVCKFISSLWEHAGAIADIAHESASWEATFDYMHEHVLGFGGTGFMSKETLLDARLTNALWLDGTPLDANTWTPIGPGTMRGAARLMGDDRRRRGRQARASRGDTLAVCRELFAARKQHWPKRFVTLELTDIAFQLCEFDKLERTRLGEGRPRKKYHHAAS